MWTEKDSSTPFSKAILNIQDKVKVARKWNSVEMWSQRRGGVNRELLPTPLLGCSGQQSTLPSPLSRSNKKECQGPQECYLWDQDALQKPLHDVQGVERWYGCGCSTKLNNIQPYNSGQPAQHGQIQATRLPGLATQLLLINVCPWPTLIHKPCPTDAWRCWMITASKEQRTILRTVQNKQLITTTVASQSTVQLRLLSIMSMWISWYKN